MFGNRGFLLVSSAFLVAGSACHRKTSMTMEDMRTSPRPHFTHMVDNAILHDMSIADIHFVPHTSEISGTGVARLDRMARLLDAYGGTVRYETYLKDDAVIKERLEHVREYLAMEGCNMDRVRVELMVSGGRGVPAERAIGQYQRGTALPTVGGGSGAGAGGAQGAVSR